MTPQPEQNPQQGRGASPDRLQALWARVTPVAPSPELVEQTMRACALEQEMMRIQAVWPASPAPDSRSLSQLREALTLENQLLGLESIWPASSAPDEALHKSLLARIEGERTMEALQQHWPSTPVPEHLTRQLERRVSGLHGEGGKTILFNPGRGGFLGALAAAAVILFTLVRMPSTSDPTLSGSGDLWSMAATEDLRSELDDGLQVAEWSALSELGLAVQLDDLLDTDPEVESLGEKMDALAAELEFF
ncbi:MAG: hypothetical protein H6678_14815 [Candidatus Delongbacteria bacterium]|nr:hypothetical protein [Candidatus Cloacimonadota bacterium]MCB9475070.1 hypothetical protein [Candidatus Delongbacteria bacterium]